MPFRSTVRLVMIITLLLLALMPGTAWAIPIDCPEPATAVLAATPVAPSPADPAFPEGDVELTVLAAASLTDAFAGIADLVEERYPNVSITLETAGSQTLVTQLGEGAPADVLATADLRSMWQAQNDGLVEGEPVLFTANRLVIVTPPDNPAGIETIDDLANDDVRLVMAAEDVPAGRYAREAICAWADDDTDALAAIGDNVVSEEIDVRSVLTKVLLGEADGGIVYASDAASSEIAGSPVNVIEFPEDIPVTAAYPIAPVASGNVDAAETFIAVVLSDEGQAILAEHGFLPID